MTKLAQYSQTALLSFLVAACGGGDGSSPPTPINSGVSQGDQKENNAPVVETPSHEAEQKDIAPILLPKDEPNNSEGTSFPSTPIKPSPPPKSESANENESAVNFPPVLPPISPPKTEQYPPTLPTETIPPETTQPSQPDPTPEIDLPKESTSEPVTETETKPEPKPESPILEPVPKPEQEPKPQPKPQPQPEPKPENSVVPIEIPDTPKEIPQLPENTEQTPPINTPKPQMEALRQTPPIEQYDEHKIHKIAVIDTDFPASGDVDGTFKDEKGNRRLYVNEGLWWRQAKGGRYSHGSQVAAVIAVNNKTSLIYGYSTESNGYTSVTNQQFEEAYNQGARIFNNSYGNTPWESLVKEKGWKGLLENNPINKQMAEMAAKDSIFVWAAGNDGTKTSTGQANHATNESHIPVVYEEARRGWITVAAVTGNHKSSYSSRVGNAAQNWGIATQGDWMVFGDVPTQGTSFAAPVVSAAVARVWEKFPWMSNHLVTQTILSTANQLGTDRVTVEPNGDIGWGVLNVNRALKGPARFDKRLLISSDNGFVTANFGYRHYADNDRLTWSNDISGDAGFKKQGTGTLYFSGKNTYTGDTHIEGGVLGISNALTASNVTVFEQGTLLAENPNKKVDIHKNLTNNGSVEIYGQGLTVGNYTASANARTIIDIHTAALDVKGTANFNGSRIVADVAKVDEVPKQQEQTRTILTAQTLTGFNGDYRVSDHIYPYIDVTSIAQKGNNIEATYKRNSTEYVLKKANTLTRSAVNTGRNLDRVLDEVATTPNSALKAQALAVLHAQPLAVSRTVESLSAEIYASTPNILLNAHRTFSRQIADQAMEKWDTQDSHLYAATAYRRYHLAQTGYRKGEVKSAQTYVGADKKWANFVLGAAVYVDRSNADFSGSIGTAKITQTGAALYGAYKGEHIYALTEFSTAHSKNQIKRSLQFPDKQQLLRNDVKSRLYGIYTELGYRFKGQFAQGQHWEVAPYLAYRTDWLHQSAFDEKSLFALRADAVHHHLSSYGMGLRSAWHWDKWRLKGSIAHRYQHRSHRSFDFEGNYIGAQSAVKIEGISAPTSLTTANLNLSYAATHALDLFAGYELSHQAGGETGNEISLGLRFRF